MKLTKTFRVFSIVLLLLLGIGALYGGVTLIIDPSGELLGLPINVLDKTPFSDFLIPGIILLIMNGFLSISIAALTIKEYPRYAILIVFQGFILVIWLTVEIIMGIFDPFFHYTYYSVSILLILFGGIIILRKQD